jgi:hypothetical protein
MTDGKDLDPFGFDFAPTWKAHNFPKIAQKLPSTMADPFVDASNTRKNVQ